MSYRELDQRSNRIARELIARGIGTEDVVALGMARSIESVLGVWAVTRSGAAFVPVDPKYPADRVAHMLADSGARLAISAGRDRGGLPDTVEWLSIDDPVIARHSAAPISRDERVRGERIENCAYIIYTSGTTGKPKGVRRPLPGVPPEQAAMGGIGFFGVMGLVPHDEHVHICGSPLYHTAVVNFVMISIQLGHKVVLMDKWDPEEMLRLIERHRVTHSHMVPTQFRRLLALPEDVRARYDVSSLRNMIHGAAPCPREVKQQMLEWWGPVVTEYYAATEGGGTTIFGDEWLTHPGSVGKAWSYSVVKVLDDDGNEVPRGQSGQVYMEMKGSTFEYYKDEEKTQKARVGNMFTTGDIGYMDDEGFLFLLDRKNDMIISGGVNIYPAEIEGELVIHPEIADVAVFGVPHSDWGEEIKAVVLPVEGVVGDDALSEDIMSFARARLAKFKLPRSIDYVDEMPRDDNGKLYKRKLRDPYWAEAERAI